MVPPLQCTAVPLAKQHAKSIIDAQTGVRKRECRDV
jgi:hypothetical protein